MIVLQAREPGGEWATRNRFVDGGRSYQVEQANAMMDRWRQTYVDGKEMRVHDTDSHKFVPYARAIDPYI